MRIRFNVAALHRTSWLEYTSRFAIGGAVTVFTGLVAKYFGPVAGGLFLAVPAIFTSSATLVEKHERQKKQQAGIRHTVRGRQAAALDARGAAMGSVGLAAFALVLWQLLPSRGLWSFLIALAAWFVVSGSIWWVRKS